MFTGIRMNIIMSLDRYIFILMNMSTLIYMSIFIFILQKNVKEKAFMTIFMTRNMVNMNTLT